MIYIKIIIAFILLAIAARQDIKTREVSNWIWQLMVIFGTFFITIDIWNRTVWVKEILLMGALVSISYLIFIVFNTYLLLGFSC